MAVSGGVVSVGGTLTTQLLVAGDGSVLPAVSMARTANEWLPFGRLEYADGDRQLLKTALSRLHSKVPASVELNVNDALAVVPLGGALVIAVSGGVVSPVGTATVQVLVAGVASVLVAASVACTEKVWLVLLRPVYEAGESHGANAPASSLQAKVEPGSLELNVNDASAVATVPVGPLRIVVSGGVVSGTFTDHVLVAAEPSVLPAGSVARTANM
jgi:hypothetical protein